MYSNIYVQDDVMFVHDLEDLFSMVEILLISIAECTITRVDTAKEINIDLIDLIIKHVGTGLVVEQCYLQNIGLEWFDLWGEHSFQNSDRKNIPEQLRYLITGCSFRVHLLASGKK